MFSLFLFICIDILLCCKDVFSPYLLGGEHAHGSSILPHGHAHLSQQSLSEDSREPANQQLALTAQRIIYR